MTSDLRVIWLGIMLWSCLEGNPQIVKAVKNLQNRARLAPRRDVIDILVSLLSVDTHTPQFIILIKI